MAAINTTKSLVGKLNPLCRRALEGAAGLCLSRTNYNVEIEHWLLKLLEPADSDLARILKHYDVDASRVNRELTKSLDAEKTGNARAPDLSPEVVDLMRESWVTASLKYGSPMVRSGHVLATLLGDRNLSGRVRSSSAELAKIPAEQLENDLAALTSGTAEEAEVARSQPSGAAAQTGGDGRPVATDSKTPSLDQFTTNLTDLARRKKIDPVLGRDAEVRQIIDILTRRRQNNPILTGEAGVGKTAVVEGFALRDRRRRRARRAEERRAAHARSRPAASRGGSQRRIREPAQIGDRRSQSLAHADHPLHRRSPHDDRRRRRRRGKAMPPICSSRRSPAASCARSPPRPGPNTKSISRRTRRWPGGSRSSRSRSRAKRRPSK